ncbi:nickel ABC transporter permease [Paenibacillus chitinolyticus]|uniref:nickel ABC transporter permease n=1 Tax=Paenibacillus chitinolyticus TaxID=79263 RepID=UPI001C48ADC4|nr:nickel ABC transporter permease [Paenibacillus chitinolyticus]MBV6713337.1 ABC transporter permease [Paenibacillus chitinolyticus]
MIKLAAGRIAYLACVLFFLSIVTFVLMKLAPGDPVRAVLKADEGAVSAVDAAAVKEKLGLNMPIHEQYVRWFAGVLRLDLGQSYTTGRDVFDILIERMPATFFLMAGAMLVVLLTAVPLGILGAKYQGRWPDHISRLIALLGISMPTFWLGLLLIYLFSYQLNWLPVMGGGDLRHLVLPSLTLGFVMAPEYIRLLRSGLLDTLSQPYIRAARGRGIPEWRITVNHALRAALLPVISLFGLSIGSLLAGSVVTESLFGWPGLGSLAMEAFTQRNYPIIQGYVLFSGLCIGLANLLSDISLGYMDPRIRYAKGREA